MTTAVHTKYGDIFLNYILGDYFWEYARTAPEPDACLEAIKDFVVSYVDKKLPDRFTWFPALSEVYVEIDPDADDIDDRELDDTMYDLITDAIAEAERMLDKDPDAFGRRN